MLLIGDSQVRGMGKLQAGLVTICQPGARVEDIERSIDGLDLKQFDEIAVWVGGNDARPRKGQYNPEKVKIGLLGIVQKIKAKTEAKIVLVSATKRTGGAGNNIKKINKIIERVAQETQVIVVNAYIKLERELQGQYLKKDGVHVTTEAKVKVLDCIRNKLARYKIGEQSKAKTRKWEKRLEQFQKVYVSGEGCRMSNFWTEDIRIDGWEYTSGEQAYQHIKAMAAGCYELAGQIKTAKSPKKAKGLGGKVNKFLVGDHLAMRVRIVERVIKARLEQNPMFRQELKETGEKMIEHNVPDNFWGIVDGRGLNIYGKVLMQYREWC